MATLPLPPSVVFSPTVMQPLGELEQAPLVSSGWTNTGYVFDEGRTGAIISGNYEVLCAPENTFRSSTPRTMSGKARGEFFASLLSLLPANAEFEWEAPHKLAQPWLPHRQKLVSGWFEKLDRIITELGRLKTGWDGDAAPAPANSLLNQMERVLRTLPHNTREPEVEVDPSDGSVVARWWDGDNQTAFTMTFTGNSKVYGISSSMNETPPPSWECSVDDETKIVDRIEHPLVHKVLFETA